MSVSGRIGNALKQLVARALHLGVCARLAIDRRLAGFGAAAKSPRVMATACWSFPVYSQTFVYQELTQLANSGASIRFIYSHLEQRDHLPDQFAILWKARRRLFLSDVNARRDMRHYERKYPDRVARVIEALSATSGLTADQIRAHRHFGQAFSFTRLVDAYRPDYIHSYFFYECTLFALVAAEILGIPRGVSCYADHLLHDYDLKAVSLQLERCDLVVATSKRIKQELLSVAPEVDANKILVKPNAINAIRFSPVPREEPETGEMFRLLCVSRMDPKKGLTTLVDALQILVERGTNVSCHFVGGADNTESSVLYERELKRHIVQAGLETMAILDGRGTESQVVARMHESHIFVAPFVETPGGDKDGIPTTLLEAMATELPVVATTAGSMTEVITPGQDGVLVPPNDAEALAEALGELIDNPVTRSQLGKAARETILKRFDVTVCEEAFHDRVRNLLATREDVR